MKLHHKPNADSTIIARREFFVGAPATVLCAPAIVRAASLMQVRGIIYPAERSWFGMVPRMWLCWTLPPICKLAQGSHCYSNRQ